MSWHYQQFERSFYCVTMFQYTIETILCKIYGVTIQYTVYGLRIQLVFNISSAMKDLTILVLISKFRHSSFSRNRIPQMIYEIIYEIVIWFIQLKVLRLLSKIRDTLVLGKNVKIYQQKWIG